jgi:hypothetical protein
MSCQLVATNSSESRIEGSSFSDRGEQARLLVAAGGCALGLRPAIVLQPEQGELPGLSGPPGLNLLPAQFEKALPTECAAIDHDHVRFGHGAILEVEAKGPPLAERP